MAKTLPKTTIPELLALLEARYGKVTTALAHENAFQLLVATVLSAQTTDKLVNSLTPALFTRYATPQALAAATPEEVEPYVRRTNFFRTKAKNLVAMAKALVEHHGGEVPRDMGALVALPGVARKTANVVLGSAYGIPSGIVVDTHVARLSLLLGLTAEIEPVKIERDLMALVPQDRWILFGHMLIHHGREICIARRPRCDACPVHRLCPSAFVAQGDQGDRAAARTERRKEKAPLNGRRAVRNPSRTTTNDDPKRRRS